MALFFFIVSTIAVNELFRLIKTSGLEPQFLFGGFLGLCFFVVPTFILLDFIPPKSITLLFIPLLTLPIVELFRNKKNAIGNMIISFFPAFYISIPFVLLMDIAIDNGNFNPYPVLGFFILIWVYDTGAYISGKFLGRHKLFERISPKKTWEGLIGGAIFAIGFALLLNAKYFTELSATQWAITAVIVVIFGTLGDLIESMLKRNANVKDSGNIMPGHGGMMDRFDSAIFAAPFFWMLIQWI